MLARELVRIAEQRLAPAEDSSFSASVLFEKVFGRNYRLCFDTLDDNKTDEYLSLVDRRCSGEPLQYIVGSWPFMEAEYTVGPGVLIPRPETEEVVEQALREIDGVLSPVVYDLCAGTGCIGISISRKRPDALVFGVELMPDAFPYFEKNASTLAPVVNCIQGDVLEYWQRIESESVDLIVSNPPYISASETVYFQKELSYEPITALVAEDDGLLFYKSIASNYYNALKIGGKIVFEIGYTQSSAVESILHECGYRFVTSHKDSFGNDRIVCRG